MYRGWECWWNARPRTPFCFRIWNLKVEETGRARGVDPTFRNDTFKASSELVEMQIHCLCHPRPTESETLGWGPTTCVLTSSPCDSHAHSSLRTTNLNQLLKACETASGVDNLRMPALFLPSKWRRTDSPALLAATAVLATGNWIRDALMSSPFLEID